MSKEAPINVMFTADDFGLTEEVNEGIVEVIKNGPVRNVSVIVDAEYAESGASLLLEFGEDIAIGLHLILTTGNIRNWWHMLGVLTWSKSKIDKEFQRQVNRFHEIFGHYPDYIDGHGLHVHLFRNVQPVIKKYATKHGIPFRGNEATINMGFTGRLFPSTPKRLIQMVRKLSPGDHEIVTHPGFWSAKLATFSPYHHRYPEVTALTDPTFNKYLRQAPNIVVKNWKNLKI